MNVTLDLSHISRVEAFLLHTVKVDGARERVLVSQPLLCLHLVAEMGNSITHCERVGEDKSLFLSGVSCCVITGKRPRNDSLCVANEQSCLFAGTEKIVDALHLQCVVPGRHPDVPDGVTDPSRVRVFIARMFAPGNPAQCLERNERGHEFRMTSIEENDVFLEFRQRILLTGLDREAPLCLSGGRKWDNRNTGLFEPSDNLIGKRFLEKLARPAHRSDLISLPADQLLNAGLCRHADPAPKEGHLRMHMTQPFPYLVQWEGGPAVPVASTNTSP